MDYTFSLSSLTYEEKQSLIHDYIATSETTGYVMDDDMNEIKTIVNNNKDVTSSAFETIFPKLLSDEEEIYISGLLSGIKKIIDDDIDVPCGQYYDNTEIYSNIAILSSGMTYLSTNVDGANNAITGVTSKINAITDNISELSSKFGNAIDLHVKNVELDGTILKLTIDGDDVDGNEQIISTDIGRIIDGTSIKIDFLSSTLTGYAKDITLLSTTIDNIQPTGTIELESKIETVSGDLDDLSTVINGHIEDTDVHVTASEKSLWNAKSGFSGSYNDLSGKPDLTIYETRTNVTTISSSLNNKIEEVSGKIPTSTRSPMITYATSGYSYTIDDACKFFYIDEEEDVSFAAKGDVVSDIYDSTLSGGQLYATISAEVAILGQVTKVDDLTIYSQPASGIVISGTFEGTNRYFEYYGTYLNSFFNISLPIWKDRNSETYLYGAKHWDDTPEWCVTTYLPSDGASPVDQGLYYSSTSFGKGTLLHPFQKDFNNSKWEYEDGPYGMTVAADIIGEYPVNVSVIDVINASTSGSYAMTNSEFSIGSGSITYNDIMNESVTLDYYTLSYTDSNSGDTIAIGTVYSNGSAGNMPQPYIKLEIMSNGETSTYGKFGNTSITGSTWPTVLNGEYRELDKISEWENPSDYYSGTTVTIYDVSGDRKGYIATAESAESKTAMYFARIPMIMPDRLTIQS